MEREIVVDLNVVSILEASKIVPNYGIILVYKNEEIFGSVINDLENGDWILDTKRCQERYSNLGDLIKDSPNSTFKLIE